MKKNSDNIESKLPKSDGMTAPEGYFDEFVSQMTAKLPERPELEELIDGGKKPIMPQTMWQRIRPYVYMAAMFAGVWCMLKMFSIFTTTTPVPFESNPIVAEALSNESFVNDYIITDMNQWDIYDDLMNEGITPSSLADSLAFSPDLLY